MHTHVVVEKECLVLDNKDVDGVEFYIFILENYAMSKCQMSRQLVLSSN